MKVPMRFSCPSGREQHEAGFRAGNRELDPALLAAHRLIGKDPEAEFSRVKGESAVLVRDRNGGEFDGFDHAARVAGNSRAVNVVLTCNSD